MFNRWTRVYNPAPLMSRRRNLRQITIDRVSRGANMHRVEDGVKFGRGAIKNGNLNI